MNLVYDYKKLQKEISELSKFYRTGSIGKTELGRDIPYVFMGKMSSPQAVIFGSTHAREYITTSLVFMQIQLAVSALNGKDLGVWFVPMLNIDGVELCQKGLKDKYPQDLQDFLLNVNNNSRDFSLYKANINGVDINNNFPARWGMDKSANRSPSPSGYIGRSPASESETVSAMRFIKQVKPKVIITYHTKGEVIFWDFNLSGERKSDQKELGDILKKSTGYPLVGNGDSVGGLKDWAIMQEDIFAYTVEVGSDRLSHPLKSSALGQIYNKNKNIFTDLEKMLHYEF